MHENFLFIMKDKSKNKIFQKSGHALNLNFTNLNGSNSYNPQRFSMSPNFRKKQLQVDTTSQNIYWTLSSGKLLEKINSICFYNKEHNLCLIKMNGM